MSNTPHLQGKAALVLGGSRGIGAAIARRLGSEGVRVALTYATSPDKALEVADYIERNVIGAQEHRRDGTGAPLAGDLTRPLGGARPKDLTRPSSPLLGEVRQ